MGEHFGWEPFHVALYDKVSDELIGAMPLYRKTNSYGEFVFDHAWANAYAALGLEYFPKLITSIPYTPVAGQRLLYRPESERITPEQIYTTLIKVVQSFSQSEGISSWHCLFPTKQERAWLDTSSLISRIDCQFHWHNRDYDSFDDFLSALVLKKRKNIRQERKCLKKNGIRIRVLDGDTASEEDWYQFDRFYQNTFLEKSGHPTLNVGFFIEIAKSMPTQIVLVLADRYLEDDKYKCIAGALMFCSDTTLYGRHWGCIEHIDMLHFEVCYYQGIEYCIKNKLKTFEPGAQGEHKVARGFLPTKTQSFHWLNQSPFQRSIEQYVEHEKRAIEHYIKSIPSPYKNPSTTMRPEYAVK